MQFLSCFFFKVGGSGIEAAWAGGSRGREVIDRFLPMVTQLLSNQGLFYLVTIAENCPGTACFKLHITHFLVFNHSNYATHS